MVQYPGPLVCSRITARYNLPNARRANVASSIGTAKR